MHRSIAPVTAMCCLTAVAGPCPTSTPPVIGTPGNNFLSFQGETCAVSTTLVNPYTGESLVIEGVYSVNSAEYYDGLDGLDSLAMTTNATQGDLLRLRQNDLQTFFNIEIVTGAAGNDIVDLSDATFVLPSIIMNMGTEDDVAWGNVGNDTINGSLGNDKLNGGPGDDTINGGTGDDEIYFGLGSGVDEVEGGNGQDVVIFTGTIAIADLVIASTGDPGMLMYTIDVGVGGDKIHTRNVEGLRFADNSYRTLVPCPADVSPLPGDLVVNITDLLAVIAAWGAASGPADVNSDGTVNIADLLAVISAWGSCP